MWNPTQNRHQSRPRAGCFFAATIHYFDNRCEGGEWQDGESFCNFETIVFPANNFELQITER